MIVNDFLRSHFERYPFESVDPFKIEITKESLEKLVRYARLIARGRTEVSGGEAELPEDPRRVILLLQTLVRGLALADDRGKVTNDDMIVIRHVAFSSIPSKRRALLQAVLAAGGPMTSRHVEEALNISRPTALERVKELGATGICDYLSGESGSSQPDRIQLSDDFQWLLPAFKESRGVRIERRKRSYSIRPHTVRNRLKAQAVLRHDTPLYRQGQRGQSAGNFN